MVWQSLLFFALNLRITPPHSGDGSEWPSSIMTNSNSSHILFISSLLILSNFWKVVQKTPLLLSLLMLLCTSLIVSDLDLSESVNLVKKSPLICLYN